jgi:hypothetical protein
VKRDPTVLLNRYRLLPKHYSGEEFHVDFPKPEKFLPVDPETAESLGLPIGSTISTGVEFPEVGYFKLFAFGSVAEDLLDLPQQVKIHAVARTIFAVRQRPEFTKDGMVTIPEQITGLLVVELVKDAGPRH